MGQNLLVSFEFKTERMRVGKLRFMICVWFLFMCGSCLCVENSCLKVSWPENLKGTYECAVSNFGVPQHGGTLTGLVVYPKVNKKACNSFNHEFSFKAKPHAGSLPVFLLVDGGECWFTWKARNAQNAGAAGVLVAYDHEFLPAAYLPKEVDGYNMENLTIPSALIRRSLGDSIKKALYDGEFVRVNLEWTEAFDEQVDMNNKIDEGQSNCDDQIEEHDYEWDVHPPFRFMWRFLIKSAPFWRFLMMNVKFFGLFL